MYHSLVSLLIVVSTTGEFKASMTYWLFYTFA